MKKRLCYLWQQLRTTARLMVGLPSYENYVAHRQIYHPGEPYMSYEAFFRERQEARYAQGKNRCC